MNPEDIINSLHDPRSYAHDLSGRNILLHEATRHGCSEALVQHVRKLLSEKRMLPFSVALSMAPSARISQILWKALSHALDHIYAQVVLCILNPECLEVSLPTSLPSQETTVPLVWYAPDDMDAIHAKQWHITKTSGRLPAPSWQASTVRANNSNDLVHIRYLIDFSEILEEKTPPSPYFFAQTLNQAVQAHNRPCYLMPFAHQPLFDALIDGSKYARDISFQIFTSQAVKEIRQRGKEPCVLLKTQDKPPGIHTVVLADQQQGASVMSQWTWPLLPSDDWEEVLSVILSYLRECRLTCVQIS